MDKDYNSNILSSHTKTDPDELLALMICEDLYKKPFYKSERPDLYSNDMKIGIEVTRAYPPEYENYWGNLEHNIRGGKMDEIKTCVISTTEDRIINCIIDRCSKKLLKLQKYEQYQKQCLYVRTCLFLSKLELRSLPIFFDNLLIDIKKNFNEELKKTNYYSNNFIFFDEIILECCDMVLIWSWKYNELYINPNLYCELNNYIFITHNLIKSEEENGISAVDNTPYKKNYSIIV